jgi:1,4-dihydroxy-2-naphthoyl-CoA synthase
MTDGSISIDTGTDELLCAIRDRVAVITLNRPEARNSLSDHLTPALRRMIKRNGDDPDVGALLITGAGSAFCSGGDVKGMGGNTAAPAMSFSDKVARLKERQRTLTGVLVSVRKPTIAALPGPAAGAGLAIALACDIRIAAESAIDDRLHEDCAHRRLRHFVAIDSPGRDGACPRTDVPVRTDRCTPLRSTGVGKSRGA